MFNLSHIPIKQGYIANIARHKQFLDNLFSTLIFLPIMPDQGLRLFIAVWLTPLRERAENPSGIFRVDLEVTENTGKGFNAVKKRRVAERTFAWIFNFRRNSKDYEMLTENSETMIQISMISILVRRLARQDF